MRLAGIPIQKKAHSILQGKPYFLRTNFESTKKKPKKKDAKDGKWKAEEGSSVRPRYPEGASHVYSAIAIIAAASKWQTMWEEARRGGVKRKKNKNGRGVERDRAAK